MLNLGSSAAGIRIEGREIKHLTEAIHTIKFKRDTDYITILITQTQYVLLGTDLTPPPLKQF